MLVNMNVFIEMMIVFGTCAILLGLCTCLYFGHVVVKSVRQAPMVV